MNKKLILEYLEFIKNNYKKKIYLSKETSEFLFNQKYKFKKKDEASISLAKKPKEVCEEINSKSQSTLEKHIEVKEVAASYEAREQKSLSYEEIYQLLSNGYNFNGHNLDAQANYLFLIPKSIDHEILFEGKVGEVFRKMIEALKLSSYQIIIIDETNFDKEQLGAYLTKFLLLSKAKYNLIFSAYIFKSLFSHGNYDNYQGKSEGFSIGRKKFFSTFSIQNLFTLPASMQQKYKKNLWQGLQSFLFSKNEPAS